MATLSVDILKDWFNNTLDLSCVIENVVFDGTNSTLTLDDVLHIREGMTVTISAVDYTVISSDSSANEIVLAGDLTGETSLIIEGLFYTHGTPIRVNADNQGIDIEDKYPMVYLYELLEEDILPETNRNHLIAPTIRLFILDTSNLHEWTTTEHYNRRIRGIAKLTDRIIRDMRSFSRFYTEETTFKRINHANWGVFADNKGHSSTIFNEQTSGLELRFPLTVRNCN